MPGLRDYLIDTAVQHVNPNWFPTAGKTFVSSMQGNRAPISESDFTAEELEIMRGMIRHQGLRNSGSVQYPDYAKYSDSRRAKGGPIPASVAPSMLSLADPLGNVQTTLGRFSYLRGRDGSHRISDTYDFNPVEGSAAQDVAGAGPYGQLRMYGGNKMPPGQGRQVSINLGRLAPDAH